MSSFLLALAHIILDVVYRFYVSLLGASFKSRKESRLLNNERALHDRRLITFRSPTHKTGREREERKIAGGKRRLGKGKKWIKVHGQINPGAKDKNLILMNAILTSASNV